MSDGLESAPSFPRSWRADILSSPPLIAPARQYIYPRAVPGEEDALARGALLLQVWPRVGGSFQALCALGFRDASLQPGVWSCPRADDLLALAGGYAYLIDTGAPENSLHVPLRPVTTVLPAVAEGVLLLAGFHAVCAIGAEGLRWTSARLSWEGLKLDAVNHGLLHGTGWDMMSDRDLPFTVDLRTGEHTGGAFLSLTASR